MEAKILKLLEILSTENIKYYQIPKYQRGYSWGKKECTTLFNDIIENHEGYFLGSIIGVRVKKHSFEPMTFQLIDGQQRITSLSLLLLALYSKIKKFSNQLNKQQRKKFENIEEMLVHISENENEYLPRLTLQVLNGNNNDYLKLLFNAELFDKDFITTNFGNRKIAICYNLFKELIGKYVDEKTIEGNNTITVLFNLENKIKNIQLVFIDVNDNKNAYMLFESLNNRGLPLSAIDLIKNNLISLSDDPNNPKKAEKCYEQWEHILEYLTDNYGIRERFLRQYYNAFREEINAPYKCDSKKYYFGNLATKTTLLEIYEELMKKDFQHLLDDLEAKAKIYSILINNSQEKIGEKLKKSLYNLEHIQGAPGYLLLLYIFNYVKELELSEDNLVDIVNYVVSFFVRRNITDYPATRNLIKLFTDCIDVVKKYKGTALVTELKLFLKRNASTDDLFEEKLRGDAYINNVENTRFLLSYYETKYETSEIFVDPYKKENGKYYWTIEHIFPEGDNIPKHWIDMIANGDKILAEEYLKKYVHKIGNLTLTGYNPNLSNRSFEEKKKIKKDNKYIGFMNKLVLNEDVVKEKQWTIDCIERRTNKLVDFFLKEFTL